MDNLIKNKKIIILCSFLIFLTFVLYLISLKDESIQIDSKNYEYLKNYKSNEFVPVYVSEDDVVKKYLNDFKNNMIFSVEDAYNTLNKDYREKRFKNIEGYKKYLEDVISLSTYSMEVDKYSVSNINGYKIFNVYDKSGYQYIFKEISIMNYEVYLDEYTVTIK